MKLKNNIIKYICLIDFESIEDFIYDNSTLDQLISRVPFSDPVLTQIFEVIWHHKATMS